jgi:hypothetical protein
MNDYYKKQLIAIYQSIKCPLCGSVPTITFIGDKFIEDSCGHDELKAITRNISLTKDDNKQHIKLRK